MAAAARLNGWAITTPPGYLRAPRFHGALDARPLPFKSFARMLSLHARRGVLGALPARAAGILRKLIAAHCVEPSIAEMPWLAGQLRVLQADTPLSSGNLRVVGS